MDVNVNVPGGAMDAQLTLPDGTGPHPAVLLCPGLTRDIEGLAFLHDALLANAFAVLAIRYRGMNLLDDDDDCRAALDYLAAHPAVDPGRMAMVGHSRGSMASLRTAATDSRVKAVGAIHPVTDFLGYVRATRTYAPSRFEALVSRFGDADPDLDPAPYETYAAINYADQITVPTLLIAGAADLHSPAHHSVLMHEAMERYGKAKTRLEIVEGGHFFEVFYLENCRSLISDLVVEWMTAHL